MATIAQFSQNIRKRGTEVENAGARLVRRTARAVLKKLVYGTPVDKGVARSNWRVSIGAQTYAKIPAYAPGRHLGIAERANANATIEVGFRKIDELRPGRGNPLGSSLYITNNAPYIERLEAGYSPQNRGWVNDSVSVAREVISNFRIFTRGGDGEGDE